MNASPTNPTSREVRPPAHAGRFYPADVAMLRAAVRQYIDDASPRERVGSIRALIAPHAGYRFSGAVAGAAYRAISGQAFDRVLLLGPAHYVAVEGAAVAPHRAFATPLGEVAVDSMACMRLARHSGYRLDEYPHEREHGLEVHLPFLRETLAEGFEIVPVVYGAMRDAQREAMSEALFDVWEGWRGQGRRPLIVVSTDTYHGEEVEACRANDVRLCETIETLDADRAFRGGDVMTCGWAPLSLTLGLARRLGATEGKPLARSDSCEAGGGGDYVVGYVGAALVGAEERAKRG